MRTIDYSRVGLVGLALALALAVGAGALSAPHEVNAYGQGIPQAEAEELPEAADIPAEAEQVPAEDPGPVPEPAPEPEPEPASYAEPAYSEPAYAAYTGYAPGTYDSDFRTQGVVYGDDGTRYTWYSQRALPGEGLTELNANGRAVSDEGFVVDADGYIAVATRDHERGSVIDTPFGEGKVYDYCPVSGTVDVYTDF